MGSIELFLKGGGCARGLWRVLRGVGLEEMLKGGCEFGDVSGKISKERLRWIRNGGGG
jgi:hypothetical protein